MRIKLKVPKKIPLDNNEIETESVTMEDFYNSLGDIPFKYQDFEVVYVAGTRACNINRIYVNEELMKIVLYEGDDAE